MDGINFLPWRERRKMQEKKQFIFLLFISFSSAIMLVIFLNFYLSYLLHKQMEQNQRLRTTIAGYAKKISEQKSLQSRKKRLISQLIRLQNIQASLPSVVQMVEVLIQMLPEGIVLTRIYYKQDRLRIWGKGNSEAIALMLRNIEKNQHCYSPKLQKIPAEMEMRWYQFKLQTLFRI